MHAGGPSASRPASRRSSRSAPKWRHHTDAHSGVEKTFPEASASLAQSASAASMPSSRSNFNSMVSTIGRLGPRLDGGPG